MHQKVTLVRSWYVDVLGDPIEQTEAMNVGSEERISGLPSEKGMTQQ